MFDRSSRARLGARLLFVALLAPVAPLSAQGMSAPAPVPIPQDSVQSAVQQFRVMQQRFEGVQQEALSEQPELMEEQAKIQAAIENAVFTANPELRVAVRERIPAIQREVAVARQAQDRETLVALNEEYQAIQARMQEAQTETLEEEVALQNRLNTFQDDMMAAMVAVDPDVEDLFRRMQALAGRLQVTIGG